MKIKNLVSILLCAIMVLTSLVACGGDQGGSGNKTTTYTLEAEYIDLSDVAGAGESSSQSGVQMIYGQGEADKAKGWSNGYFVGYTYVANLKLDFNFNADSAATATITLALGSELGDLLLTTDLFEVQLNGVTVPYSSLSLKGGTSLDDIKFYDLVVNTNAQLKAGANTLSLIVRENKLVAGERVGAPCVDCVKITTTANITWNPKTSNPDDRGSTDLD